MSDGDPDVINVGAGNGSHHVALLPIVERIGVRGADIHVINVDPEVSGRA